MMAISIQYDFNQNCFAYFVGKLNEYNEMSLMKTQFSLFNMQAVNSWESFHLNVLFL